MKKIIFVVFTALMVISLAACGANNTSGETESTPLENESETLQTVDTPEDVGSTGVKNALVAYFSATGHTRTVAEYIAECAGADIYEIVPEDPYTDENLNYGNDDSRTSVEQNDDSARPAISAAVENIDDYDVIFLGYPIWWGEAPKIMYTFLESYDFSGKTIIPFCTSGSSPIGSTTAMQNVTPGANWLNGKRFSGGASSDEVMDWVNGLDLE